MIDENFFYCRKIQPSNKIGSWIGQCMEKKFLAIIAVSSKGKHFFEALQRNESIDANRYIQFLINMQNYFSTLNEPILTHNMRLQHDNAKPQGLQQIIWKKETFASCANPLTRPIRICVTLIYFQD